MIRHIVLIRFKPGTPEKKIARIFADLEALTTKIPGVLAFAGGRSESPEKIERGYMHGFVIDFADWDSLASYAENETHRTLGGQLVENALGGRDGLLVFDLAVAT
ncbi:MAG: Dabb family protein [Pseudomonadota bacterium]